MEVEMGKEEYFPVNFILTSNLAISKISIKPYRLPLNYCKI
jgi:hypothetical protein